jgi:hypothetical protein
MLWRPAFLLALTGLLTATTFASPVPDAAPAEAADLMKLKRSADLVARNWPDRMSSIDDDVPALNRVLQRINAIRGTGNRGSAKIGGGKTTNGTPTPSGKARAAGGTSRTSGTSMEIGEPMMVGGTTNGSGMTSGSGRRRTAGGIKRRSGTPRASGRVTKADGGTGTASGTTSTSGRESRVGGTSGAVGMRRNGKSPLTRMMVRVSALCLDALLTRPSTDPLHP